MLLLDIIYKYYDYICAKVAVAMMFFFISSALEKDIYTALYLLLLSLQFVAGTTDNFSSVRGLIFSGKKQAHTLLAWKTDESPPPCLRPHQSYLLTT